MKNKILINFKYAQLIILFVFTFLSCKNIDKSANNLSNYELNGVGCGTISPTHGDITLFTEVDSSTYIVISLVNELSVIKNGNLVLSPTDTNKIYKDSSQIILLDFNTKNKIYETLFGNVKGYIYPCSDLISPSHLPDILKLVEGTVNIQIQETKDKERFYFIHLINTKFSKNDKILKVNDLKRKVVFTEGMAG